jgi:hypothetical protein
LYDGEVFGMESKGLAIRTLLKMTVIFLKTLIGEPFQARRDLGKGRPLIYYVIFGAAGTPFPAAYFHQGTEDIPVIKRFVSENGIALQTLEVEALIVSFKAGSFLSDRDRQECLSYFTYNCQVKAIFQKCLNNSRKVINGVRFQAQSV